MCPALMLVQSASTTKADGPRFIMGSQLQSFEVFS